MTELEPGGNEPLPHADWAQQELARRAIRSADAAQQQQAIDAQATPAGRIATRRWKAETAGIAVNGIAIDTGRDSQAMITGAAVSAMLDPAYAVRWKTPGGFIDLQGQQIIDMATAVRAHVQACFDREATLLATLAAGTLTAAMLEEGWPDGAIPAAAAG